LCSVMNTMLYSKFYLQFAPKFKLFIPLFILYLCYITKQIAVIAEEVQYIELFGLAWVGVG